LRSPLLTISIAAGHGTVTIDPTADLVIYEGNETVIATIASVSGEMELLLNS
jgi:hypothetical protein